MNEIEKQILKNLQFLVSMHKPELEIYQEEQAKIMTKNHLLLNPIQEEDCCEMPERIDAIQKLNASKQKEVKN